MKTFEEFYCEANGCDAEAFRSRLFWSALPVHALPFAVLLGGRRGRYFAPERDLITGLGEATSLERVRDEVHDFFMNPANAGWMRRRLKIRVSTSRLYDIARRYFAPAGAPIRDRGVADCTAHEANLRFDDCGST